MRARGSRRAKASKRERRNEDWNGASARGPSGVDCISPATGAPVQCAVSTRSYNQLLHSGVPPFQWAWVQSQRLLPCLPEAVTNPFRSSIKRANDSVIDSIAAVPLIGARGDLFPLPTLLSAEDEVLVIAAKRDDHMALEADALLKAGHDARLQCIVSSENRADLTFSDVRAPSVPVPVAEAEFQRMREIQIRDSWQNDNYGDAIMAGEDFQKLLDGIITPTDESNLLCGEEVHSSTNDMIRRGKRKTVRTPTGSMTETLRLVADLLTSEQLRAQLIKDDTILPIPSVPDLIDLSQRINFRNRKEETQLALTCRTNQTRQTRDISNEQDPELSIRRRRLQSAQTDQGRRKATISCQTHLSAEPIKASECQTPLPAQKDTSRKGHHLSRRLLHVSYYRAILEAFDNHPSDTHKLTHLPIRTATDQLATIT